MSAASEFSITQPGVEWVAGNYWLGFGLANVFANESGYSGTAITLLKHKD